MSQEIINDIKTKYLDQQIARREAKRAKEQAEKDIQACETRMKQLRDVWTPLKVIYPDLPPLDESPEGSFEEADGPRQFRGFEIKQMIVEAIDTLGRFVHRTELHAQLLNQFRNNGLREHHIGLLSQYLKVMKDAGIVIRAKGDKSNHQTYWGLPIFTFYKDNKMQIGSDRIPKTPKPFSEMEWDLATGRSENEE